VEFRQPLKPAGETTARQHGRMNVPLSGCPDRPLALRGP
jgi:hypothetical protein